MTFTTPETATRTSMPSVSRSTFYVALVLVVLAAGIFKIADLDFWWHLKTGQVITEQREFQYQEIFSYTAAGREYIDHEWLFQVLCYFAFRVAGPLGVILMKCAVLALIYLLAAKTLLRHGASILLAGGILILSIIGGLPRFIERPEVFSTLFLVLVYLSIDGYLRSGSALRLIAVPIVSLIWANLHAAVVLGIVLQAIFLGGGILERFLAKRDYPAYYNPSPRQLWMLAGTLLLSLLATAVNPYGFRVLMVPFELTAIINSGLLNNEEWQRPSPYTLPLFYLCLIFTFAVQAANFRKLSIVHFLFSAFLGYIAMKYFRNTGMFCILSPFLVSPYVRLLSEKVQAVRIGFAAILIPAILVLTTSFPFQRGIGIADYFPEKIAQFTTGKNLQGNMLNSYAFGGYFIWKFYPQRKIFIDGRNEVFLPLLQELVRSRDDNRMWNKFLGDYKIEYALLNYVDKLEEVTFVNEGGQPSKTYLPFTATRFPRSRWALVYWDDIGMVLVRRKGINQSLLPLEYTSIFPEGTGYQEGLIRQGRIKKTTALEEIQRKLREDPNSRRAREILRLIQEMPD